MITGLRKFQAFMYKCYYDSLSFGGCQIEREAKVNLGVLKMKYVSTSWVF